MNLDNQIVENIQKSFKEYGSVCKLIEMIRTNIPTNENISFIVIAYFMEAFNLNLREARELAGAKCVGGGAYSDLEIEELIGSAIRTSTF